MIEIKDCSKAFGAVKAVNKVSLEVGEREVFGLVGSNGAGKSTLLRMIAGVMKPDEGEIRIDGISVYDDEKAKSFCFIYQTTVIFHPIIHRVIWRIFTGIIIPDLIFRDSISSCISLGWMKRKESAVFQRG